jgi:FecR protein
MPHRYTIREGQTYPSKSLLFNTKRILLVIAILWQGYCHKYYANEEEAIMDRQTLRTLAPVAIGLFVLLALIAPANAQSESSTNHQPRPGSLNYVEGRVTIGSEAIDPKSVGSAELEAGQSLTTEAGKAEILLTPGAFLRLGDNTSIKMLSSGLTNTKVQVQKGRALLEVAEIHKENELRVVVDGVTTELPKKGLYEFDADRNQVRVFDGKAEVQRNTSQVEVKEGREFNLGSLNSGALKAEKFNEKLSRDDLYNWSSLRSKYLAEANTHAARKYGSSGWGTGWYWAPWYGSYTFIPRNGFLYSPFGWGFYSPGWVYRSPYYFYGRYPHRFYGRYRGRVWPVYRGNGSRGFYRGRGFNRGGGFRGAGRR